MLELISVISRYNPDYAFVDSANIKLALVSRLLWCSCTWMWRVRRAMEDRTRPWPINALVLAGLLLTLATYSCYRPFDPETGYFLGAPFGRDFVNFWLGGQLTLDGRVSLLSDVETYQSLVRETFSRTRDDGFLFSYPPSILPLLAPFGALPYGVALAFWTALNLGCFLLACRTMVLSRAETLVAVLSPAFLMTVIYGHFGGVASLSVASILGPRRAGPWMTAMALGLLSVKPQLFVVLVVLAVGLGQWKAAWRSVLVASGLVLASVALWGVEPWLAYVAKTLPYHADLLARFPIAAFRTTISAYAWARMDGATQAFADGVQIAVSIAVVGLLVACVRRTDPARRRAYSLAAGAVAVLPYANHYDLAIVVPALVPLLRRDPIWSAMVWLGPSVAPVSGIFSLPVAPAGFLVGSLVLLIKDVLTSSPLARGHEPASKPGAAVPAPRPQVVGVERTP